MLLNRLFEPGLDPTQQLIIIVGIRKTMSSTEEPPVKDILETSMIQVVSQIF